MKKWKTMLLGFGAVLLFALLAPSPDRVQAATPPAQTRGINVEYHTQAEIRKMWKDLNISLEDEYVYYTKEPLMTPPYDPGELDKKSTQSALNTLNMIRYIAGLPHNVQVKDEYQKQAQAAALLNAVNDELSHFPSRPKDMNDALYKLGADGASHSNLATGIYTLNQSLYKAYMNDESNSNISAVGHRRWLLNPGMLYAGFGYCGRYSATYAHNNENTSALGKYKGVAWPAQNTPLEYFNSIYVGVTVPWSFSFGEWLTNKQANSIVVTLKRTSDGKTWKFSKDSADGYYHLAPGYYGQPGDVVIFRPSDIKYKDGDQFTVSIKGDNIDTFYTVNLFYVHTHKFKSEYTIDIHPDCVTVGQKSRHCSVKGCEERLDVQKIPVKHDYKTPVFTWNGYSKCNIKLECRGYSVWNDKGGLDFKPCPDSPKIVKCAITTDKKTKATLRTDGERVCTAKCTVGGKQYSDTRYFYIKSPNFFNLSKTSLTYNGKTQTVSVTVKDTRARKISPSNYTVKGNKAKAIGRHTVTITFKGDYSGTEKLSFTIKPRATAVTKVTPAKKALTVKCQKQTGSGYQIQAGTSRTFASAKTVNVKNTSKKITGLKAKTRYYVRARTYKTIKVNGKTTKLYSNWSAVKSARTK